MILSAQSIRKIKPVEPFHERTVFNGMTYGLGPAGYDVRIAETLSIAPKSYTLASTIERFEIPQDILGKVADKSTWARKFLTVQNTIIEPSWRGFLTLELTNHSDHYIYVERGTPIAQIIFMQLDEPTEQPYEGKYQDQKSGPQDAQLELPILSRGRLDVLHAVRQEQDEYACICGMRWDVSEGEEHP